MRKTITTILSEAKSRFEGYTALLDFRYANLCVEADGRALLSTTITIDSSEFNIEKVAWVNNPQKDQFAVYPMDQANILEIAEGIKMAHPEFKAEIKDWDDYPEQARVAGQDYRYLLFSMPEINKDRHDLLLDGVKILHDQWDVTCQQEKAEAMAKAVETMVGQNKDVIDKVKNQIEDFYTTCHERGEGLTADKKKEIEEGYQRYLERETQRNADREARGENAGYSMKMGQDPEEDDF